MLQPPVRPTRMTESYGSCERRQSFGELIFLNISKCRYSQQQALQLGQVTADLNFYAPVAVALAAQAPSGNRQVVIRPSAGGGTEFLFLANRHWGIAKFATVAFCVWTAVIRYFFWGSDSLSLSLFVFGDLLLLYWALWVWFSTASATFEKGTVTVLNSLLGIGKSKKVAYSCGFRKF